MRAMRQGSGSPIRIAMLLLALVAARAQAFPAHVDLYSASRAYRKGDYAQALQEFLALARLGQPKAQLDVATMYLLGQGARQSDIHAYAWAKLAAQNGQAKGLGLAKQLLPSLALAPGSTRIAGWITAPYTPAALRRTLLPRRSRAHRVQPGTRARMRDCRPVKFYKPLYPIRELMRGEQERLVVAFTVLPDGTTRLPRILFQVSDESNFDALARESVLRSRFAVRSSGSRPIQCALYYQFVQRALSVSDYGSLESYLYRIRRQARAGDPMSELTYGMVLVGLPQLHKGQGAALPWFVKAAQAGIPLAEFETGVSLLTGWGIAPEPAKGLRWLRLAAAQNQPDAEALLAMRLLRGKPFPGSLRRVLQWLDQAAAQDNRLGEVCLSAVLAASPQSAVRDPQRALLLEKKAFEDGLGVDPTGPEIRAAAQAAEGHFTQAVKSEREAIGRARDLGWILLPLQRRLALYRAGKPWYGDLLDYDSPTPEKAGS